MVHDMKRVAEGMFLNEEAFLKFADEHGEQHGAFRDKAGTMLVSTWYADDLISAARAAGVPRLSSSEILAKYR